MSQFSEDEILIIRRTPLISYIGNVQQLLHSIKYKPDVSRRTSPQHGEAYKGSCVPNPQDIRSRLPAYRDAVSDIIVALQGHPVAMHLQSRNVKGIVAAELALVFHRLVSDECDIRLFLPLTTLVQQRSSDSEIDLQIWTVVLDLLSSLSRITPSSRDDLFTGITPSSGSAPRTFTSAPKQSSEQIKRLIGPELREELRSCGPLYKAMIEALDSETTSLSP